MVMGIGFRVYGWYRVEGWGFKIEILLGFMVYGWFRVEYGLKIMCLGVFDFIRF